MNTALQKTSNRLLGNKYKIRIFLGIALSLVLYIFNIRPLLPATIILGFILYLPSPKVFHSVLSRFIVSVLLLLGIVQLSALIQFLLFPETDFNVLALITTVLSMFLIARLNRGIDDGSREFVSRVDLAAVVTTLFFVAAFFMLLAGRSPVLKITEFASIQSIDAAHHQQMLADMNQLQHLNYRSNKDTYPKGFHISVTFIQDSLYISTPAQSWRVNAAFFMGQYFVWGVLLTYMAFMLAAHLLSTLSKLPKHTNKAYTLLALSIGPWFVLFYTLPFLHHGFLNYFYICTILLCALIYLDEHFTSQLVMQSNFTKQWPLIAYLILVLGISTSWPLLVPPLVLIPLSYALPDRLSLKAIQKIFWRQNWLLVLGFSVQFLPLIFQLYYGRSNFSEQGLNAQGGIRVFHYGLVLLGVALMLFSTHSTQFSARLKRFTNNVLIPFYVFLGALMMMQYFTVGELRYYSIKSAYLVEIIVLLIVTTLFTYTYVKADKSWLRRVITLPLILCFMITALIGLGENPLKEVRNTFRSYSSVGVPVHFETDTSLITDLGLREENRYNNTTVLHHDSVNDKLFANAQVSYWANILSYNGDELYTRSLKCGDELYTLGMFSSGSKNEQDDIIRTIRECAGIAKQGGRQYFIVTDESSKEHLKMLFGDVAVVIF